MNPNALTTGEWLAEHLDDPDVRILQVQFEPDMDDYSEGAATFGDRLALWGTVGTARLWDCGSPDEIREEVMERIATLEKGGGLLISPAYDVDFAPFENIAAFFEAVQAHG